jgi:hypothetical protein
MTTIHSNIYFKGIKVRKHERRYRATRLRYIPVDVVAGRQLFCTSSALCTEGRTVVFEQSSQHGPLVFWDP